ncbi:glycosyltransferase family 4 protein [Clostridium intestinale]|uniref:Group 1 glycosyl transferase n=1 Tax=Clostridium intestinale URNW TaxID=1294142 RepID=U2NTF4_9CLOT|nr:glycosyltransferase family 4 protein [Clostridium intestinale]ERK32131.1 group 1 glycosyl transferase [Clostridium intestinale URNW]
MNLLFITSFMPKENAPQAGVNITYNLLKLIKENFKYNIDLLCLQNISEIEDTSKDIEKVVDKVDVITISKFKKIFNLAKNINIPVIASVRYDNRVVKYIKDINSQKKYDFILLDYTQNINYYNILRKFFPAAKIIIIEHDVSFLGFERKYKNASGIKKILYKAEYSRLKNYELKMTKKFDHVITLNLKDSKLLGLGDKVKIIAPFINKFDIEPKQHKGFNIMFWGAMNRNENEDAVIYFMENIWNSIDKKDTKFYIVGSKPSERIKSFSSENVIVTGFVKDPKEYFEVMDVSVIPLRLGAGIKIKVLESLANNIPVITTSVGAEGIGIRNRVDGFVTNDVNEFVQHLEELKNNTSLREEIKNNALNLIKSKYSFESNYSILREIFGE